MSISSRIERVRTEDLLEEEQPSQRAIRGGVGARRQLAGLGVGVLGLPLLTLVLDSSSASLETVVLIYLVAVVVMAAIGGVLIAVMGAIAATLVINYFFVAPVHTLDIEHRHQALTLGVFLVVAIVVSGALDFAARRTRAAEQAAAQTEMLRGLAGADVVDETSSLKEVIQRAREAFHMESVVLKVRDGSDDPWIDVERSGWAPPGQEAPLQFDIPINRRMRLVGRGPALFAEDHRVLTAFAAAAQSAYETRQLSAQAKTAKTLAETDRLRTALLGAAARELDAPVAGIEAGAAALRDGSERADALDGIEASAHRLRRLGADLLDASRLQGGTLAVAPRPAALAEIVAAAVASLPGALKRVRTLLPTDLAPVLADPALLERVLANLLDDALRHGDEVELRATSGASSARVEVVASGSVHEHGSDLGMAVARGFTEAMGGALAHDTGGDGTTIVRLRLPLAASGEPAARTHS